MDGVVRTLLLMLKYLFLPSVMHCGLLMDTGRSLQIALSHFQEYLRSFSATTFLNPTIKKKLDHSRLDRVSLLKHNDRLNETLQEPWLCNSRWQEVREAIVLLSDHVTIPTTWI